MRMGRVVMLFVFFAVMMLVVMLVDTMKRTVDDYTCNCLSCKVLGAVEQEREGGLSELMRTMGEMLSWQKRGPVRMDEHASMFSELHPHRRQLGSGEKGGFDENGAQLLVFFGATEGHANIRCAALHEDEELIDLRPEETSKTVRLLSQHR